VAGLRPTAPPSVKPLSSTSVAEKTSAAVYCMYYSILQDRTLSSIFIVKQSSGTGRSEDARARARETAVGIDAWESVLTFFCTKNVITHKPKKPN
jgi:hypothetical protein